jgi:hypothetical protein
MSLVAMRLTARERTEGWIYRTTAGVIGIWFWLCFVKDIRFVSSLDLMLLMLAVRGLIGRVRVGARDVSVIEPTQGLLNRRPAVRLVHPAPGQVGVLSVMPYTARSSSVRSRQIREQANRTASW